MPEISVIVPVYNVDKYLEECLDSLVNQTFDDIEIICVNDGSTDNSLNILKEYEQKDSRIRIISQKNSGPSAARNAGIKAANGKYVTFVDADDYVEKDTYETARKYIENSDLVAWGINVFGEHSLKQRKSDKKYYQIKYKGAVKLSDNVILETDCSVCNKLFKNEILKNNKITFPEGLHYEDALFWWKYAVNSDTAYFIDSYLYNYRRRDNSIMTNTFSSCDYAIEHLYIVDEFYKYLNENKVFKREIYLFVSVFRAGFYFAYSFSPDDKLSRVLEKATEYAAIYFREVNVKNRFVSALLKRNYDKLFEPELSLLEMLFCIKNLPVKDGEYKYKLVSVLGLRIKVRVKRR